MTLSPMRSLALTPVLWRWALSVVFAALVVVGLLGMHTLSTGHSEPAAVAAGVSTVEHDHASMTDTHAAADVGCADCGSGSDHDALMLACVLGLLVALLLIARAGPGMIYRHGPLVLEFVVRSPLEAPLRPPSLLELSISRT